MIHRIFLPPKLPSEDDSSPDHETALRDTTIAAFQEFREWATEDRNVQITKVRSILGETVFDVSSQLVTLRHDSQLSNTNSGDMNATLGQAQTRDVRKRKKEICNTEEP
jgi:hypothetical protein